MARPLPLRAALRRRPVLATALSAAVIAGAVLVGTVVVGVTRRGGADTGRYVRGSVVVRGDTYPYVVFVPTGHRMGVGVPLIVVLHGCSTTADQQAIASNYAPVAEQSRFVVLYPDVDPVDVEHGGCWKGIWNPAAEGRGQGDARAIADMTEAVIRARRIDPARVYLIGISAGGFESSILGAGYPDIYAAIGIHSGAAYRGAQPGCLAGGPPAGATAALAHAALAAMGQRARVMPVIVFHGDRDPVIPYRCGEQALRQWLDTDRLVLDRERRGAATTITATVSSGRVAGGRSYALTTYRDRRGCSLAELWTVHGLGHAWSGGSNDPSVARYTDPLGPSAAAVSARFFLRWSLRPDDPRRGCNP